MPHNEGRLVVWSFSKDKVFEVTLPEKGTFVEARFDYTSNIYQPKMIVEYEPHPFGAEVVGTKEIEINLITGKEV